MISPAVLVFWQRYGLTAMLGLALVGFLGAIGYETGWGQAVRLPLPTANDAPRTPDMLATLPGFALPSLESAFKETADRPLFTPTRRPAAVSLAGNAPAMKKGQFKLSGTSVNNDLTVAFLIETATGKTVRVTKGKEINGMTLDTVDANRVVLKQGEETEELALRTASSPPPVKVAAPPPAVPGTPAGAQPGGAQPVGTQPAGTQPVATANVGAAPQSASRPAPPINPLVPAQGNSQLPGFVNPSAVVSPSTQVAPAVDNSTPAQRRRRAQTQPPQ